ncbi:MAG: DUF6265 family protein [Pyrinomonadaceae bacterium]
MRNPATIFLIILISATFAFTQAAKPSIKDLAFISGCWEINDPARKRLVSEQWMSPVGNAMMGMSRTVRNEKMGAFEFLRIVEDSGEINYISKPSQNKEETAFKLIKWSVNEVTFENPTHDFPQRIIYKLTTPDSLFARIEGTMNGKLSGVDFPMARAKCA